MFPFRQWLGPTRAHSTSAVRCAWKSQRINATSRSIFDDDTPSDLSEDNEAVNGVRPGTLPFHKRTPSKKPLREDIKQYKDRLKEKFPEGWNPPRKLSRDAMDSLRELHRIDPEKFNTPFLASKFKISSEAVRRILKSRFQPSEERKQQLVSRERRHREEAVLQKVAQEDSQLAAVAETQDRILSEANSSLEEPIGAYSRDKLSFR